MWLCRDFLRQNLHFFKTFQNFLIITIVFAVGFVGATPLVKNAAIRIGKTKAGAVLEVLLLIGILLICTAYLVDGSFSPFLYFRF